MNDLRRKAEEIIMRGDAVIAEKKRRKAIIMRSAALGLGAAAIIGVGICANVLKPPKKPTVENSGIITETTSATSVETTVKMSAQTGNATANAVYTSKTTVTGVKEKNSATTSAAGTSEKKTVNDLNTTQATITPSKSTSVHVTTSISSRLTEPIIISTVSSSINSTMQTTTSIAHTIPSLTTTTILTYDEMVLRNFSKLTAVNNEDTYFLCPITLDSIKTGKLINELVLNPKLYTESIPHEINAKIYEIKNISSSYEVAITFDGIKDIHIFRNYSYSPRSLGNLIDDLNIKEEAVFNSACIDTYNNNQAHTYKVDGEGIIEVLENARYALNNTSYDSNSKKIADISITLPIAGIENNSIGIMDDGYITTNLTAHGSYFYIGKENTDKLLDCFFE